MFVTFSPTVQRVHTHTHIIKCPSGTRVLDVKREPEAKRKEGGEREKGKAEISNNW